jgi:hypothetical protein
MPLKFHHPTPYVLIKGTMRAPPLSTVSTLTLISPPRVRNHLPIRTPPTASVERRCITISAAPPSSGVIGENPDDLLLSLSLSYHDDLSSPGAVAPPHGRESTMDREATVVAWSIDLIHDFFYTKTILRNPRKCQNHKKPLDFLNKSRNNSYLFQISPWTLP